MTEPLVYTLAEACEVARMGKTTFHEEVNAGRLRAVKRGRITLVLAKDLNDYLNNLPTFEPSNKETTTNG